VRPGVNDTATENAAGADMADAGDQRNIAEESHHHRLRTIPKWGEDQRGIVEGKLNHPLQTIRNGGDAWIGKGDISHGTTTTEYESRRNRGSS
jgi:hypothetical protein